MYLRLLIGMFSYVMKNIVLVPCTLLLPCASRPISLLIELFHTSLYLGSRMRCLYSKDLPVSASIIALAPCFATFNLVFYPCCWGVGACSVGGGSGGITCVGASVCWFTLGDVVIGFFANFITLGDCVVLLLRLRSICCRKMLDKFSNSFMVLFSFEYCGVFCFYKFCSAVWR